MNVKFFFLFSKKILSKIFFFLRKIERAYVTNVLRSSREVLFIIVRF